MRDSTGRLPPVLWEAWISISAQRSSMHKTGQVVHSVFSYVASRNKRCVSHSQMAGSTLTGSLHPKFAEATLAMRKHRFPARAPTGRFIRILLALFARVGQFYPVVEAAAAMREHRPSTGRGACPARGQSMLDARRRLKREIVKTRKRVLTEFPKAREKRPRPGLPRRRQLWAVR